MQAVVLAAGEGTRLRPLTDDRPKGMVEVAGRPLLGHCFETLRELGVRELVVVVGYRSERIVDHYGDRFADVPITYVHQRERRGLAHALLTAEDHIEGSFLVMLGDNVFDANLDDVVRRERDPDVDAAFLAERVPQETASRYGVCEVGADGEVQGIVEKPDDPPSNLVMTGFYAFSPRIFDACRRITPSQRGEYELSEAVGLLAESGTTVEAVELDGWRVDVAYPEDRTEATRRLEAVETAGRPEPCR